MSKIQANQIQHTATGAAEFTLPTADGSANQLLKTDGSGNLGWATDGGKVVGFGLAASTATDQKGGGSYTLVGPQLTYTATSASNKLLILHSHHMLIENTGYWWMALYRDGLSGTKIEEIQSYSQDSQWIPCHGINSCVVDAPDTSSHTYQFAIKLTNTSVDRMDYNSNLGTPQIILLEIEP
jgi:hypothetical protein